jgi:hypothetical protein
LIAAKPVRENHRPITVTTHVHVVSCQDVQLICPLTHGLSHYAAAAGKTIGIPRVIRSTHHI